MIKFPKQSVNICSLGGGGVQIVSCVSFHVIAPFKKKVAILSSQLTQPRSQALSPLPPLFCSSCIGVNGTGKIYRKYHSVSTFCQNSLKYLLQIGFWTAWYNI